MQIIAGVNYLLLTGFQKLHQLRLVVVYLINERISLLSLNSNAREVSEPQTEIGLVQPKTTHKSDADHAVGPTLIPLISVCSTIQ